MLQSYGMTHTSMQRNAKKEFPFNVQLEINFDWD